MTTLHIEFTKSTKKFPIFGWLIRAVQGTSYSHVRLRWKNTTDINLIYEASGSSVKFIGTLAQEDLKTETVKSYKVDITKEQYRELVKVCMTYAGVKYSFWQVVQIGLLNLCGWRVGKKDKEYAQVCSELVTRVLEQVLHIDLNLDPDTAGPREIDQALQPLLEREI